MVTQRVYALTTAVIFMAALGAMEAPHAQTATSQPAPSTSTSSTPLAIAQADRNLQWGKCPALFPAGCEVAVLHGDPAQPGADILLRVPPAYTIPSHWHTSAERMVLVSGELEVTYAGHPATLLRSGDYAYGPAKLPHVARCRSTDPCTLFIAFDSAMDAFPFEGDVTGAR